MATTCDDQRSGDDATRTAQVVSAAAPSLEHWLEVQRLRSRVPAVQAAIRVGGTLVLSSALGTADVAAGEALTARHRFRVASHSKTFTATLVLQLVESGALRLDDPLERWVPRITQDAPELASVTVRALLGHQGGVVRDGRDADHWQLARPFPADVDALLHLARDGAVLDPDERFKYSNVAYGLLGQVVEAAGGAPWATRLADRVLRPLGLTGTLPDVGGASTDGEGRSDRDDRTDLHATGYTALLDDEVERWPFPETPTGVLAPATGVSSTAEDLTAWMSAHARGVGSVLGAHLTRLAQREESTIRAHDEAVRRWGLGFEVGEVGSRTLVGHSGGFPGFTTRSWLDPDDAISVSVLTSCSAGPADALATGLLRLVDLVLAGRDAAPGDRGVTARADRADGADGADGAGLERWTGRFANLWGRTDVALLGGRLVLLSPDAADPARGHLELTVEGGDALRCEAVDGTGPVGERVEYAWAPDGTPASIRVGGQIAWPLDVFRAHRAELLAGGGPRRESRSRAPR